MLQLPTLTLEFLQECLLGGRGLQPSLLPQQEVVDELLFLVVEARRLLALQQGCGWSKAGVGEEQAQLGPWAASPLQLFEQGWLVESL